jgi:hypothetical protein
MSDVIQSKVCLLRQLADDRLQGVEPSKLILVTAAASLALVVGYNQLNGQVIDFLQQFTDKTPWLSRGARGP